MGAQIAVAGGEGGCFQANRGRIGDCPHRGCLEASEPEKAVFSTLLGSRSARDRWCGDDFFWGWECKNSSVN